MVGTVRNVATADLASERTSLRASTSSREHRKTTGCSGPGRSFSRHDVIARLRPWQLSRTVRRIHTKFNVATRVPMTRNALPLLMVTVFLMWALLHPDAPACAPAPPFRPGDKTGTLPVVNAD